MKNKRGFTPLGILLVVTLGVAAIGSGVYFMIHQRLLPQAPVNRSKLTTTSDQKDPIFDEGTHNSTKSATNTREIDVDISPEYAPAYDVNLNTDSTLSPQIKVLVSSPFIRVDYTDLPNILSGTILLKLIKPFWDWRDVLNNPRLEEGIPYKDLGHSGTLLLNNNDNHIPTGTYAIAAFKTYFTRPPANQTYTELARSASFAIDQSNQEVNSKEVSASIDPHTLSFSNRPTIAGTASGLESVIIGIARKGDNVVNFPTSYSLKKVPVVSGHWSITLNPTEFSNGDMSNRGISRIETGCDGSSSSTEESAYSIVVFAPFAMSPTNEIARGALKCPPTVGESLYVPGIIKLSVGAMSSSFREGLGIELDGTHTSHSTVDVSIELSSACNPPSGGDCVIMPIGYSLVTMKLNTPIVIRRIGVQLTLIAISDNSATIKIEQHG